MKRTLSVMALCGLALTACSTTVRGSGSIDQSVTVPSPGDGGPSDEPSGSHTGARQSLTCKGGTVISPDGAPYCYLLPSGLRRIDDVVLPGGGDFTTAVGIGGRDLIAVTVFHTPANTDELSDDELNDDTDQVVESQLSDEFTFTSKVGERLTVDGARTLHYQAKSKKDSFDIDIYFVYRSKGKIQVNCQSQKHRAQIQAGCTELLHTLQFVALH